MNKIQERFGKPRVLLPVVHCQASGQVKQQARLAIDSGADGVFLINQGGMDARAVVVEAGWLAENGVPFVGVNLLGADPQAVAFWTRWVHAVWSDNARAFRSIVLSDRLFFGGVAFKYQEQPRDVGVAAIEAEMAGVDVITTSGDATGQPPTVEKVRTMRRALGDHALAIASGITPENVAGFLPYVDAFLVATGIESSFGTFDPDRVRALADAIHGWRS